MTDLKVGGNSDASHLGHLIYRILSDYPDDIHQIDAANGEKESNSSVLSRSIKLALCFRRMGLQPGDVITLAGRNHLDMCIPYFAAMMNGLAVAGVDPLYKYSEIRSLLKIVKPKLSFCQNDTYNDTFSAVKDLQLTTRIVSFDDGDNSMRQLMQKYDSEQQNDFKVAEFDGSKTFAWLVTTSGTTGSLKVAAFRHQVLYMLHDQALKTNPKTPGACALHLSPIQWVSAHLNAIGAPMLRRTKVQTSASTTTDHTIDIINQYKPIVAVMCPGTLSEILKNPKACDLSCFHFIAMTGSKVYKELIIELRARLRPGALLCEMYGQTETVGPALNPVPNAPIGSCGTRYPHVLVKLVDPETKEEISTPYTTGELWTKGPSFTEYYGNPEETLKAFTPDGWYKTGDLLYRDENDFFNFVDRLKMVIKYKGYQIVPTELEGLILSSLPNVLHVAVTGIPHKEFVELPVACVVRKPGANVTSQEVKDVVANTLSSNKHLHGGVVFMESLPMTSTGKVARSQLREMVKQAIRE